MAIGLSHGGTNVYSASERSEQLWVGTQDGLALFERTNGQWREAPVGSVVYAPRNSVHTFKNVGKQPSRMLVSTSPGGFETFFSRCADEFAKPGAPDMQRIVEISAEHGIHFVQA